MKKKKYASFNVMCELAYFHYLVQGFANLRVSHSREDFQGTCMAVEFSYIAIFLYSALEEICYLLTASQYIST